MSSYAELASITTFDSAAEWAKRIIPIKNSLTSEHAREVEAVLEGKIGNLGNAFEGTQPSTEISSITCPAQPDNDAGSLATKDRSTLTFGHTPRRRNKSHLKFVASQACLLCGRRPSDAHHLRFAQPQAMGRKVSDEFTVPLCRTHHRQLHRAGDEIGWWKAIKPDLSADPPISTEAHVCTTGTMSAFRRSSGTDIAARFGCSS
jgi:hypothetical protein